MPIPTPHISAKLGDFLSGVEATLTIRQKITHRYQILINKGDNHDRI